MTQDVAKPWLPKVEQIVREFADAPFEMQQEAVDNIRDAYGPEAATEARDLLAQLAAARRAKLSDLSGRLARKNPLRRRGNEDKPSLILPGPQPRVDAGPVAPKPAEPEPEVDAEPDAASAKAEPEVDAGPAAPKTPEPVAPAKVQLPSVVPVLDQRSLAFQHSKSPRGIASSLENALIALNMLELDCRYDAYHDRMMVRGTALDTRGDVLNNLDNVTIKVRQAVLYRFGFDPGATFTYDALLSRCLDHVFDPVWDYLDGLRWDGKPRLDGWLVRYCEADDTALNRAIGRKVLVAGVRRVRSPGCKFDYIMVLEGEQGAGKSTMLKLLAGEENFTDSEIIGLDKQEQQEAVQGIWIYEIAELEGLYKSEVTKVKLFASKTVDSARPAYGRSRVDRPRRGIFVATTNEDTYLRDTTGNRRFWPVRIGKIDLDAVARDRDQLWAEAVVVEATGEPLVIPEALWPEVAVQQAARMELDPWEDELSDYLARFVGNRKTIDGSLVLAADNVGNPEWRVSTDFLLTHILQLSPERQSQNHTKRLASIMRTLGWTRHATTIRIGKKVCRGFTKPDEEGPTSG